MDLPRRTKLVIGLLLVLAAIAYGYYEMTEGTLHVALVNVALQKLMGQ